jgi:tetratricopeptide (TPR) repeat protein
MKTRLFLLLPAILGCCVTVVAQSTSGSSGSTTQTSNPALGPAGTSDIGKFPNWDTLSRQGRSGDYLLGNVAVTGGSLPWDPIPVTVTCDGITRYTTATDPKGRFVIASVHAAGYSPGNADPKAKLAAQLMGCDARGVLAGFDSSVLRIANRNLLDNPDIGTITLKREEGLTGAAVSATTLSAPKDASKAFEKARAEWIDQKPDAAQHDLEKAVKAYPQFAEAWYQLGRLQQRTNSPDAWNSFSKAAAADAKFVPPYVELAVLAGQTGKWGDAEANSAHVLELDPRGSPQVWYYNALGNYKLNKKDVAEVSATKALAMDPLHTEPNIEQLLAVILADKRDFAGALQHLRNLLTYLPAGPNAETVKQQIAQLGKIVPGAQ